MTITEAISKNTVVADQTLSSSFWDEYDILWQNSNGRSPFQSPEILKYFSGMYCNNLVAIQLLKNQRLFAAVIFKKENGIYSFLSDLKTDANFFVFHKDCSEEDIEVFFSGLFDIVKAHGWSLMLNCVAGWADYLPAFEQCGLKSNLYFHAIDYSVCPVLEGNTPEEIRNILSRTRSLRNNLNNLKGKLNAEFEVLTGDEDLKNWVQEFCDSHILRWENTSTPSKYRDADRRLFLLKCLEAWIADEILVRFAVKVNNKRIGFHICLVEGHSLVGHSMTFHLDFHKLSPAKVLLLTMAEWMAEKKLTILDFGNGNEKYKYNFANKERLLKRVFISKKTNYSFVAKSKLIGLVRNSSSIYNFYQKNIRRFLNPRQYAKIKIGYSGK